MALLSLQEEMDRSRSGPAFANGFEFDSWSAIWCEECALVDDCPLLEVALLEHLVPAAWEDRNPGALNRYVCHEYRKPEENQDVVA